MAVVVVTQTAPIPCSADGYARVARRRAAAKLSRSGSPLLRTTVGWVRSTRKVRPPGAWPVRSTRFTCKCPGWSGTGRAATGTKRVSGRGAEPAPPPRRRGRAGHRLRCSWGRSPPGGDGICRRRVRLGCWRFRGRRVVPPGPDPGRLDHFHPGGGPVTAMLTVLRSQSSARPRHSPRTAARRTARSRPVAASR